MFSDGTKPSIGDEVQHEGAKTTIPTLQYVAKQDCMIMPDSPVANGHINSI